MIAATRLRKARPVPRAASFVASTLTTARRGAAGLVVARMDSAFYTTDVGAAVSQAGAQFSITARLNASVRGRIATIAEDAWTPIHYPNAIWGDQAGGWVSDADSTETQSTHRRLELGGGRVLAACSRRCESGPTSARPTADASGSAPTARQHSWRRHHDTEAAQ